MAGRFPGALGDWMAVGTEETRRSALGSPAALSRAPLSSAFVKSPGVLAVAVEPEPGTDPAGAPGGAG